MCHSVVGQEKATQIIWVTHDIPQGNAHGITMNVLGCWWIFVGTFVALPMGYHGTAMGVWTANGTAIIMPRG